MLDVFAYLFTKKPRIRDGGFKAYLYKAARHMALRHKSKRKPLFSLDAVSYTHLLLIKHYPGSLWSNEQHERRMQYQCAVQGYRCLLYTSRCV